MKYLRSLMQQSVTACKNQAKLIQQFTLSLLYLLIIHIVALLFFFLFRLVLFTSIDGIKEQIDTITNSYNKLLYLFHISSC